MKPAQKHCSTLPLKACLLWVACLKLFLVTVSAQPSWTRQTPVDRDYYIGIGSAEKVAGSTEHIAKARDIALEQIAAGIAISITGETSQYILDQSGMVRERFESQITSLAKAELEGYELVDSWENNSEYWVYYRLNKARYHLLLDQRKRIATSQAYEFYMQGKIALAREEITQAMAHFLQAALEIGPYRGMGLRTPDGATNSYMDVEVFTQLNQLFSGIRINAHPPLLQAKLFQSPAETLTLKVNYYTDDKTIPVQRLPLKLEVLQGRCEYNRLFPTNAQGETPLEILRIKSPGNVQVKITPDIQTLSGATDRLMGIFSHLNIPERTINVQVDPVRVLIVSRESNMDQEQNRSLTANQLREFLTSAGWSITQEARTADYLLYIEASTRVGTERQGIHTAFAEGSIALTDNFSMEEIFRKNISPVNAGGPNFRVAGEQALERLAKEMIQEFKKAFDP